MTFDQIYNLVDGNVLASVFLLLWFFERRDRQRADRRYRSVLRDLADIPDEVEIENGGS